MRPSVSFLGGAFAAVVAMAMGGWIFVARGRGFSAAEEPGALEKRLAPRLRTWFIPAGAREKTNPAPDTAQVRREAMAHWADHCAICHANNGSGDTAMGRHMYPPAPDMREAETQRLSDGELFWIIQNGVRFTGMPAWGAAGGGHNEEDSWKLVRFIRHLPQLSAEEEQTMRELNPKSPDEWKEEEEEKQFLNGGGVNENAHHKHH
ncbi:MAG TPA: c-type cytochrome [Bryobacteraceae bacterium]|nr:c-type cytochrome [Bryobacteraceae bacterium]